jgi:hypothetical protein
MLFGIQPQALGHEPKESMQAVGCGSLRVTTRPHPHRPTELAPRRRQRSPPSTPFWPSTSASTRASPASSGQQTTCPFTPWPPAARKWPACWTSSGPLSSSSRPVCWPAGCRTCAEARASAAWSPTPAARPGSSSTVNARPTRRTRSARRVQDAECPGGLPPAECGHGELLPCQNRQGHPVYQGFIMSRPRRADDFAGGAFFAAWPG